MKKSVDSGKGGCVGPYVVVYLYSVSSYSASHSSLPQSVHLVPLLLHHPLKVSGVFRGTHDRKETLEGNQELISSCSSASVHSLPCGPRIAVEKESGFPAPSRFKSAEYTGGAMVGAEAEERRA